MDLRLVRLDSNSDTPLVQQIQRTLKSRIDSEELPGGYKLPSIRRMSRDWGCSVGIVERAVSTLATEGYLKSEPRRGLFVNTPSQSSRKYKDIALVLLPLRLPAMAHIIAGARDATRGTDYRLIIQASSNDRDDQIHVLEYLDHQDLAGVIISPPIDDAYAPAIRRFSEVGVPVVLSTHLLEGLQHLNTVTVDNFEYGRLAITHLLERGHRRIALVGHNEESLGNRQIAEGMKTGLQRYQMSFEDLTRVPVAVFGIDDEEPWLGAAESVGRYLSQHRGEVTAMLGWSHHASLGICRAAAECGVSVPDELSVVAMSYDPAAYAIVDPAVTVIHHPLRSVSERSARHLMQMIDSPEARPQAIQLAPQILERGSVSVLKE